MVILWSLDVKKNMTPKIILGLSYEILREEFYMLYRNVMSNRQSINLRVWLESLLTGLTHKFTGFYFLQYIYIQQTTETLIWC